MMASNGDDVVVTAVGLSKRYGNGPRALQATNLTLRRGELCALVGPNGAGKSTLINMLAGATQPTSGTITIEDGVRVGWSNQRPTIDWYLDVRQNVYMGPRLYGYSRKESSRVTEETLKVLALDSLAETEPDQLSGGQQQRVQVARSIATSASVLLLDEPTVGLDVEAAENVLGHLRRLVEDGSTVLISSHDLGLLESFCDRIVVVVAGEKVADKACASLSLLTGPPNESRSDSPGLSLNRRWLRSGPHSMTSCSMMISPSSRQSAFRSPTSLMRWDRTSK